MAVVCGAGGFIRGHIVASLREKGQYNVRAVDIKPKGEWFHEIEIWSDGEQTRSFQYVDDCIEGIERLMRSDVRQPINLGSSEMVSINQLASLAERIGKVKLQRRSDLTAPKGVRGRTSDNTLIKQLLGWEPSTSLEFGLTKTFQWIARERASARRQKKVA